MRQPVDTRGGSQVDCLESLLKNRKLVQTTVIDLRDEKFPFEGNKLMYIWNLQWWETIEKMSEVYKPLRNLISLAEADYGLLGESLQRFLEVAESVGIELVKLSPGDKKKVKEILESRKPLFLTHAAALANMMHPVYRGEKLAANVRRSALEKVGELAQKLKVEPPVVSDILAFMGFEPPFEGKILDEEGKVKMSPAQYWKSYMQDQKMSAFALAVSLLPSSQASVERVFSSAKWQAEDRERLAPEKLAMEVYIGINSKALSYQP